MEAVAEENGLGTIEAVCLIPQEALVCSDERYEGLAAQIDALTREVQALRNVVQFQGNLIANLIHQYSAQSPVFAQNLEGSIIEYRPQITAFFETLKEAAGNTPEEKLQAAINKLYQENKLMNIVLCVMFTLMNDLPGMTGDFISEFNSTFTHVVQQAQTEGNENDWGTALPKPYELPSFMKEFYDVYMEYSSDLLPVRAQVEQTINACVLHEICNDLFEEEAPECPELGAEKA